MGSDNVTALVTAISHANDFWLHLAAAAVPFALIAVVGWLVEAHLKRVDARED